MYHEMNLEVIKALSIIYGEDAKLMRCKDCIVVLGQSAASIPIDVLPELHGTIRLKDYLGG